MSPSVIEIRRLTIFMAVVLPQPEGPIRTQISPGGDLEAEVSTAGLLAPRIALDSAAESDLGRCRLRVSLPARNI